MCGKLLAGGPQTDRHEGDVSGLVTLMELESKEAAGIFTSVKHTKRLKQFEIKALIQTL